MGWRPPLGGSEKPSVRNSAFLSNRTPARTYRALYVSNDADPRPDRGGRTRMGSALPAWLSLGLHWTSSTHSAGNHPMWPRALPSQKPPSPMLRTRDRWGKGEGLVGGAWRAWGVDAGRRGRQLRSICWLTMPPLGRRPGAWQSVPRRGHCRASEPPGPLCPLGLGERM